MADNQRQDAEDVRASASSFQHMPDPYEAAKAARAAECVVEDATQVLAGWLSIKLGHTLASIKPIRYGPNTLVMAESIRKALMDNGLVIARRSDLQRIAELWQEMKAPAHRDSMVPFFELDRLLTGVLNDG